MPRISPEHAEARRRQILDAARACFLRDGFHQTSMTDIQREAQLSAGAIYLYFKAKNDIILGIAQDILATVGTIIPEEPALDGAPLELVDIVRVFLARAEQLHQESGTFHLAIQVWAEAIRDPAMQLALVENMEGVRSRISRLLEVCQQRGVVPPDVDREALSLAMIGLGQGYIVQRSLFDFTSLERYADGVTSLLLNAAHTGQSLPDQN